MVSRNTKILATALIGLISFTLIGALFFFKSFEIFQLKISNSLYGRDKPGNQIIIVRVDNPTINSETGLGDYKNWSRSYYAKVIENINKFEPKVIGVDFVFRRPKDTEGDKALADSLSKVKAPVIIYRNDEPEFNAQGYFSSNKSSILGLPLPELTGLSNIILSVSTAKADKDGVIRKIYPGIFDGIRNIYDESFAFAISRAYLANLAKADAPPLSDKSYLINTLGGNKIEIPLESGQMLIRFFSHPLGVFSQEKQRATFNNISFLDAYNNQFGVFDPANFKDKIVLIGLTAATNEDLYFTPVDPVQRMSGVEIQANAIQTILEQKFLRNMTTAEVLILLFLLSFGSAFVFMFTRIRWSVLYLIVVPTAYALLAPVAFDRGLIFDLVHPYLAMLLVFIAAYMYRYLTEFKEKLLLRGAFSKYVNPKLVEQIVEHPENLKLGGEKREVTVLFTDIAHFTTISEKLSPESLVALLNEYFEAMSEVIMANGGTVDKFEGDAIMAFFGAPLPQNDHAGLACKTALQMRAKLLQLMQKWKTDPPLPGGEAKPQIDFRCGLSSGEVIVGNVGSASKFNYTVMGDIVNLGSRLEGANKHYETNTILSQKTAEKVTTQFEMRVLDTIRVVGKKEPIKVYELIAEKGQLPANVLDLLAQYNDGINLYYERKFAEALAKFQKILESYPNDGPSKLYRQRCEVLRDFPPKPEWDGVYEMGSK